MKYEEAIKTLEAMKARNLNQRNAVYMGIEALQKQIDEKPVNGDHCPCCGGIIDPNEDKYVCFWCGQRLDWSEVE